MFGGLLASGIAKMDGVQGYSSWRWVFILEGLLTIVLSVAAFFLISDFPEDVQWLTDEEREFVIARARTDPGASRIDIKDVWRLFADVKNLFGGLMYFGEVDVSRFSTIIC